MKKSPRVQAAPDRVLDGRWTDRGGSVLELEVHDDGRITGIFRSSRDGNSYRPYRVTGTYTLRPEGGRGVVGSVSGWPRPNAVTVWTGEYVAGSDELRTSWLMTTEPGMVDLREPAGGDQIFRRTAPGSSMARAG